MRVFSKSNTAKDAARKNKNIVGESRLVGHIDKVENGFVFGWAIDNSAPNQPIELAVWCGKDVVAFGDADVMRQDLVDAFGTSGRHGFALPLHGLSLSSENGLILRERKSNFYIASPEFRLESSPQDVRIRYLRVDGVTLRVGTENKGNAKVVPIGVFDGEQLVGVFPQNIAQGSVEVALSLPARLFDGRPHLLGLSLGDNGICAYEATILRSIITPWEHLKESYRSASILGAHPFDAMRYYSLRSQLAGQNRSADIDALVAAHEVVSEMNFERREFPTMTLPEVAKPVASVIIPVYNRFPFTYHCVASLILAKNRTPFEVIIADDCSTDETEDCERILKNAQVIRTDTNCGFVANCNNAATHARGEFVVFLNNDVEVTSHWLDELVEAFARFPSVGIAGSKLLNDDGTLQDAGGIVWGTGTPWNVGRGANARSPEFEYARQVDYVSGAAFCIRRKVWEEVGAFSKEFEPAYYEDTDLAFKVRAAGYSTWYVPSSEVIHFEGKSHGKNLESGIKKYQVVNAPKFKRKWVKEFSHNGPEGQALELNKDRGIVGRVLMIDHTTPTPDKDAGSYAAIQEIRLLQSMGLKVTFIPENLAHLGVHTSRLAKLGVEVWYAPFILSVREFLEARGNEFGLVYITRHDVAARHLDDIRGLSKARIVLNIADLHFLRELRAAAQGFQAIERAVETRDAELEVLRRVDAILTYNDTEKAVILSHNLREENIFRCPWIVRPKPTPNNFEERNGLLFLGGFQHLPNVQSVEWFVKEVLPLVALPSEQKKLYVVGSNVPERVLKLASDEVEIVGYVDDLGEMFDRALVFVAPLRFGAGVKGKVIEAMAYGLPIVGTSVAAEATGLTHAVNAFVSDDPRGFADAITELVRSSSLWHKFRDNALAVVENNLSEEQGRRAFSPMLDFLGIVHLSEA